MKDDIAAWTDLDYAQAAIDMLPGTVEEIEAWMITHHIPNEWSSSRGTQCPVARWVAKWTDQSDWVVEWYGIYGLEKLITLPEHVHSFIRYSDDLISR